MIRRLVALAAVLLTFVQPTVARAGDAVVISRQKMAYSGVFDETWKNGSFGGAGMRLGYGEENVTITWQGRLLDDEGNVLLDGLMDLEMSLRPDTQFTPPRVVRLHQRRLVEARFRLYNPELYFDDDTTHEVSIKAHWDGYGPVVRSVFDLGDGQYRVYEERAANVTGHLRIDGYEVPAGDLSISTTARLTRERVYAPPTI
jgi:hypothetical protein